MIVDHLVTITLSLIVSLSYLVLLTATSTSIPRSHLKILLPRLFNYYVPSTNCQTFVLFNSDGNVNVNEDPLPLFADKFYYPDCFLNRDNFGRVMGVLAFGRGLAGDGVQRVFAALGWLL